MAHPDHDAIVAAFLRVDPSIQSSDDRGGPRGYTHLHGPSQVKHPMKCSTHCIVVEKVNGTVSLRGQAGSNIGGHLRPDKTIDEDDLGASVGTQKGEFTHALTANEIRTKWSSFDAFARDAIAEVKKTCPPPW